MKKGAKYQFFLHTFLLGIGCLLSTGCTSYGSPDSFRDGYNQTLPLANMQVVVQGENATTVGAATQWLEKVGLQVKAPENFQRVFDQEFSIPLTSAKEPQLLHAANLAGADYLIMIETFLKPTMVYQKIDEELPSSRTSPKTLTVRDLSVAIRGLNAQTGHVDWAGMASYPEAISGTDEKLTLLTWDALATAWGAVPRSTQGELLKLHRQLLDSPAIDILTFPQGIL